MLNEEADECEGVVDPAVCSNYTRYTAARKGKIFSIS